LAVDKLGGFGLRALSAICACNLLRDAQQAAMRRVLHQSVFEGIDCIGAACRAERQLGIDEAIERGFAAPPRKAETAPQQRVGETPARSPRRFAATR